MVFEANWRNKSLETLEKHNFGTPDDGSTSLVKRCLELCKIPINNFSVEDLRLMIGQDFSLRYLIPIAIEHLKADIFVEGDLYPGDLLKNVLLVDTTFWKNNTLLWKQVSDLISERREELAANGIPTQLFDSDWR